MHARLAHGSIPVRTKANAGATDLRHLLPRLERLYTAVVSDCLDRLGIRDKALRPAHSSRSAMSSRLASSRIVSLTRPIVKTP